MDEPHKLRIVVAVCGHRDLRAQDEATISATVRDVFARLQARYPTTPQLLLTSLAAGADRLAARTAIALGVPYRAVLPMPPEEYRQDFSADEDREFLELLAGADACYVMPWVGDTSAATAADPLRRARQYARVGAHVARAAHVLLAIWDGHASEAVGGTAQIVSFRLAGVPAEYRDDADLLDPLDAGPVYHVLAGRRSGDDTPAGIGSLRLLTRRGEVALDGDPYRPVYEGIEQFNRDAMHVRPTSDPRAPDAYRLEDAAAQMANAYQQRYYKVLVAIVVTSAVGAGSFVAAHLTRPVLAGGEWEPLFIIVYFGLLGVATVLSIAAKRAHWKDRFIEYRALELGLTIQRHWDLIGIDASVADYYLRLQGTELDWIRKALRTVQRPPPEVDLESALAALRAFVDAQRDFFAARSRRDERNDRTWERWTLAALVCGFAVSVVLLTSALGDVFLHGAPRPPWLMRAQDAGERLSWIVALCTVAAASAHEYSHRRAFRAQARRYEVMLAVYLRASTLLAESAASPPPERLPIAQRVAREIGREALAENGEWLMMQRDLPLEPLHV